MSVIVRIYDDTPEPDHFIPIATCRFCGGELDIDNTGTSCDLCGDWENEDYDGDGTIASETRGGITLLRALDAAKGRS